MGPREVVSLWATRKSADFGPELLTAWDEFSIDENLAGWEESCRAALDAMGDDLDQYRYVTLRLDGSVLHEAFFHSVTADVDARASDRGLVGAQPEEVSGGALRQRAPETREETEA